MRPLRSPSKGAARGRRTPGSAGFPSVGPGGPAGRPVRVLHPRAARLPHLHGAAAGARSGSSTRRGASSTPARTSRRASRSSCTTGSWSTARRSATAPTSGPTSPPTTCAARRTSSSAPTAAPRSDAAARRTIEDFRTNRYDERTRDADADRRRRPTAFRRLVAALQPLLLRPDDRARPAPQRDHRSRPSCAS